MPRSIEVAILAGGCFCELQGLLRRFPGVQTRRVGYIDGDTPNVTYRKSRLREATRRDSVGWHCNTSI